MIRKFGVSRAPSPWVGADFSRKQQRVLDVGESHYTIGVTRRSLTVYVVKRYAQSERYNAFFSPIGKLLRRVFLFRHLKSNKRLWDNLAFVNYLPSVLNSAAHRPTDAMFRAAYSDFRSRVCELRPTHILLFSVAAWNSLPNRYGAYVGSSDDLFRWRVSRGLHPIVGRFPHPGRGRVTGQSTFESHVLRLERLLHTKSGSVALVSS